MCVLEGPRATRVSQARPPARRPVERRPAFKLGQSRQVTRFTAASSWDSAELELELELDRDGRDSARVFTRFHEVVQMEGTMLEM